MSPHSQLYAGNRHVLVLCILAHLCIHSCVLRAFISILSDGGTESSVINMENPIISININFHYFLSFVEIIMCITMTKSGESVVDI